MNTRKVHVLLREVVEDFCIVDRFRLKVLVVLELGTTEHKRQKVIIVQSPDAMAACGLEPVGGLDRAHHLYVAPEDAKN